MQNKNTVFFDMVMSGLTHYTIGNAPALAAAVIPFHDATMSASK
jgi:hypothetical protein